MKKIFTLLLAVVGTIGIASAQSKDFGHQQVQQHNREYKPKFVPYQVSSNLHELKQIKQERKMERNCDQRVGRVQSRYEKSQHRYADKRFVENNTHRW